METNPVHVFARWKVKEGNFEAVLALLKEARSMSLKEEGNLFYEIHQSKADANTLILFEGYANEAAQQAHVQSAHFMRVVAGQIVPLLEEREVTLTIPIEV
ncbi:antibiotic biosynthesis monooxygenase [Chitinophaga filiformis]|uniref:putative quinol monooxygenase n=1 Tax=Chitinophaga filiformis TaxID=104663 RepID=UPI001F32493D|nr:putative quinol monooxygenase [Chitinophaga filiformis]MCF6405212.1 antibiotic biosynthesis monooxygenase [Chitinophaga filiformis]